MTLKQRLKLESPLRGRVMSWVGKECLKWDSSLGLLHLMREEASHVHAPGKPRVADDCGGRRHSIGRGGHLRLLELAAASFSSSPLPPVIFPVQKYRVPQKGFS